MDDNIVNLIQGGKQEGNVLPDNSYVIEDINGTEYLARGFAIFTPHHIAIMKNGANGAVPVFLMPLDRLGVMEIASDEDDDQEELPGL